MPYLIYTTSATLCKVEHRVDALLLSHMKATKKAILDLEPICRVVLIARYG